MKRTLPVTLAVLAATLPTVGARHCRARDAHTTAVATTTSQPSETPALVENALPPFAAAAPQQPAPKSDPPKKRKLDADLSGFDTDSKSDKKVSTMLGGSRSAAVPSATLLAPKRAKLYGSTALFSWTFTGHNEGYVFLLTDEDETQIVRQPTKDAHYLLDPAIVSKLEPGAPYYWRIQVLPNTLASDPLEFTVVTADERTAIDKALLAASTSDPYETGLARARVLVDHRLWFDALGAYDALIAKYPKRSELYEDRATIYAQLPATKPQSEADKTRAK
jgi:hypothetical protein